ncbi:uncharacterized protein [Dysidea avara]|uniref:uncharacterized protein n=1 Tax=Dysidea avara TaxID=196820 RepID=UPI00332017BF
MAPSVISVCSRWCRTTLPFCAIVAIIIGILSTAATVVVGYYFEYNEQLPVGLCFCTEYPALRRACTLDLTAGVMGILVGSLLLIIELVAAYINQRDWKILCFIIKLCLASFTILVATSGAVQGTLGYRDYCEMEDLCRFSKRSDDISYKMSYDFVAVVVFSATNAVWWIILFIFEFIRGVLECSNARQSIVIRSYQQLPTIESELDELPASPPAYSDEM